MGNAPFNSEKEQPEPKPVRNRDKLSPATPPSRNNTAHNARQYTRFVSFMKLVLPFLALVLIGLVFLLPGLEEKEDAIILEYKKVTLDDNKPTMTNPRFLSSDKGNQQYVVTADKAVQEDVNSKKVSMINLQADITLKNGQWLSLTAPKGKLDPETGLLDLDGGIDIFSDNGNQIYAQTARVFLNDRIIESPDGLKGHGPLGEIEADRLVANQLNGTIRFEGHVKMTLYP